MPDIEFSLPIAVPPEGTSPTTFYQLFTGKIQVTWTPTTNMIILTANEDPIAGLYAPFKSAMQFIPRGGVLREATLDKDTLLLKAWPTSYVKIKSLIPSEVPIEIRVENVDVASVRQAVQEIYTSQRSRDAVATTEKFMAGNGLLLVNAGTLIGKAVLNSESTPRREAVISMYDGFGIPINPVQFFANIGSYLQVEKDLHPLLAQLDLDGWIEIIALNSRGNLLPNEPYVLHLPNTTRSGSTDNNGRIYETDIEGAWAIELTNYPAFFLENVEA